MEDRLRARCRATPQALALVFGTERWSYADLDGMAEQLARGLYAAGVRANDHVAALLPNNPTYVALIHALARLGAVLIPLNSRLSERELAWQMAWSEARFLVAETVDEGRGTNVDNRLSSLVYRLSVADLLATPADSSLPSVPLDLDATQAIVFTSGTTGQPKGAMLTFGNHFWGANASLYRLGLQTNDRWLSCLPLYHVGGLAVIFRSCLYGTAVVLHERFDLDAFRHSLGQDAVTLTSLVPTMLHRLLEADIHWPPTLRLILLGGAAATPELLERCYQINLPVVATYGLTEAASQVATQALETARHKPGCVGKPLMFTRVRVVDDAGLDTPPGQPGEILVQGPTVMAGYFRDTEATVRDVARGLAPYGRHWLS